MVVVLEKREREASERERQELENSLRSVVPSLISNHSHLYPPRLLDDLSHVFRMRTKALSRFFLDKVVVASSDREGMRLSNVAMQWNNNNNGGRQFVQCSITDRRRYRNVDVKVDIELHFGAECEVPLWPWLNEPPRMAHLDRTQLTAAADFKVSSGMSSETVEITA